MFIDTVGQGPSVVLIHGWAMHSGLFAPLTEHLRAHCTVHLVDLPGHGRSQAETSLELAPVVDTLIERLPKNALWAGWSLGGLVALTAAQRYPQHVSAVALMASNPCFVSADDWNFGMPPEVFDRFAEGLEHDYHATVERFLALEAMGSANVSTELRELRQQAFQYGTPALGALRQGLALLQTTDLRAAIPQLTMPSVWIAGRRDRLVPPNAMRWAAENAPNARYLELNSGHLPFVAHPDAVNEALQSLLENTSR